MKVIAINGSPHKEGNTYLAIRMVLDQLEAVGIETEIVHVGGMPIRSCVGCGMCQKKARGKCSAFPDDGLNEVVEKIRQADGLLLGSPVHYAGISGVMKCFCDRLFYLGSAEEEILRHKVGAAVIAVRRTGGSAAWDTLQKYLQYTELMVATSNYWPVIHGARPGEALQDEEGKQIMTLLGKNMAWMLQLREQGLESAPAGEKKVWTNFIR